MDTCMATKKDNKPCTRSSHKGGYCKQHGQTEKIAMFKKELAKLHDRVKFYCQKAKTFHEQIELIQKLDWIKYKLIKIGGPNRAFKYTVLDYRLKDELEDLFDAPFSEISQIYQSMLERRNLICHKYTSELWIEMRHPYPSHNPYLTSLCN